MTDQAPMSTTFEQALQQWEEAKAALSAWKEREMVLRKAVVAHKFDETKKGTQKEELPDGRTLKTVIKHNQKLGTRTEVEAALKNIDPVVGARLILWEPKLVNKEYKGLGEADRGWIDQCITTTPGAHSLEVVEAKPSTPDIVVG